MSMMAVFACTKCGTEVIRGYFRGAQEPAPLPRFPCLKCQAKTSHSFREYLFIDERSDAERTRESHA